MIFVRRRRGHHQTAPDNGGAQQVGQRFDAVCDQRVGMPGDACYHLRRREQSVGDHPDKGHAQAALETGVRHEPSIAKPVWNGSVE